MAITLDHAPTGVTSAPTRRGAAVRTPGLHSTPARQRRMPWIALGLLLVFGAGLAFAAWSRAGSARVAVLVTGRDVDAGEVLTGDAVSSVEVNVGPGVDTVRAAERDLVVGKVARGPIPAGTLVSAAMVGDEAVVPSGQAVVGAVLAPGAYPTAALRPGDRVLLVATAAASDPGSSARELGPGQIWAVANVDSPGAPGLFVSLVVPAGQAAAASNAAAQQQLRLVLVGSGA